MREIKFRGKELGGGKWIYGYAVKLAHPNGKNSLEERHYIITGSMMIFHGVWILEKIRVLKSTVGQSTGIEDKNGKEIYKDDILKISDEHLEVVEWIDETNWNAEKCPVNGWVNNESIYKKKPEIIGNIHEDKHLLDNNN